MSYVGIPRHGKRQYLGSILRVATLPSFCLLTLIMPLPIVLRMISRSRENQQCIAIKEAMQLLCCLTRRSLQELSIAPDTLATSLTCAAYSVAVALVTGSGRETLADNAFKDEAKSVLLTAE
jgi:hypothetical protein